MGDDRWFVKEGIGIGCQTRGIPATCGNGEQYVLAIPEVALTVTLTLTPMIT